MVPNEYYCTKCGRTSNVVKLCENCPFCTTNQSNWESRFMEQFIREDDGLLDISKYDEDRLLQAIRTLLAEQREEIVKELEATKWGNNPEYESVGERIYDRIIDDVLQIIKKETPSVRDNSSDGEFC